MIDVDATRNGNAANGSTAKPITPSNVSEGPSQPTGAGSTDQSVPPLPPKVIDPLRGVALPKVTPGTARLATGLCDGEFLGAVYREASATRQFDGVEYTWQITSGPDAGKTCSREVGVSLRAGSHRLKLSCDLAGREFAPGEEIDLSGFIGKRYRLRLAKKVKKDGTVSEWVHVESCMLIG